MGFRYFTSADAFRSYVVNEVLSLVSDTDAAGD